MKDASTKWGFPVAVRMVTEAFLQAPSFLYRLETAGKTVSGTKAIALDNYEVASRLSYLLTDSMPDADLMSVAHAGKLATVAGLEEQARRLLKSDQARQAVASRIFWDEGHTVQSLLTDKHAYANKTLAPLYGASSASADLVWTEVQILLRASPLATLQ